MTVHFSKSFFELIICGTIPDLSNVLDQSTKKDEVLVTSTLLLTKKADPSCRSNEIHQVTRKSPPRKREEQVIIGPTLEWSKDEPTPQAGGINKNGQHNNKEIPPPEQIPDLTGQKIDTQDESNRVITAPLRAKMTESRTSHANLTHFRETARLKPFTPGEIPPCIRPNSYNNDLELGSFTPSKYTWAGEQRRGVVCHVTDSSDPMDHTRKAMDIEFFLAKPIPLPAEIKASLSFIQDVDANEVTDFWLEQLAVVRGIVRDAAPIQKQWEDAIPSAGTAKPPTLRTVALLHLMKTFGLGGDRWIRQFIFGFPIVGEIEQTGVFPRDDAKHPPPDLNGIWEGNMTRFTTRARASGVLNAQFLWDEAMTQVEKGWLAQPLPIDPLGNVATYSNNGAVIAFRFGVDQLDKIRSCDDLKYSTTNKYCTVWTPIKLPTWDHIGQMALEVKKTNKPWSFIKVDHEAAYKQLPLETSHTKYAMVTLRHPTLNTWFAFPPQTLLFGAEAAVTHYNCFSRVVAILINRIFGIPQVSYFDDLGAQTPSEMAQPALDTIKIFLMTLGIFLKHSKTGLGEIMIFFGLEGSFPNPHNDMTLSIALPEEKKTKWAAAINKIIQLGTITRDQLESLIGRLSFPQTSVFGRFGRPMMAILHQKHNARTFHPLLSEREVRTLQWWVTALTNLGQRQVRERTDRPDVVVFTDAATSTATIAAVTIIRKDFDTDETIQEVRKTKTGKYWETLFESTNLIYGLEMLALLALLFYPNNHLRNKNVTFHIDNMNAFEAIVKNTAGPSVIVAMTHLIWHRIYELGITPWFEWVPGTRNIADLPTRDVPIPFKCVEQNTFPDLRKLHEVIKKAKQALDSGRPIIVPRILI